MATTIVTKFGVSPGIPPADGELAIGELAVNHADKKIYTKTVAEGVVELAGGGGGGDPGELPVGTDGDMLYNNGGTWEVSTPFLELQDNPDKPGQRELALKNQLQFTQYDSNGDPAVELIGDTLTGESGIRVMKSGTGAGLFGLELECANNNTSRLAMRRSGTSTAEDIQLTTSTTATEARIYCTGPIVSAGGTSQFAGITMAGTNAGINMQNLHRVFNHPDPSTAESTNVANARWVNNNYVGLSGNQTIAGIKNFTSRADLVLLSVGNPTTEAGAVNCDISTKRTILIETIPSGSGNTLVGNFGFINQQSSDARLKENIVTLEDTSLGIVNEIEPVAFDWKADGRHDLGFIAQEVEKLIPEAVPTNDDGYLGMRELPLIATLWKAVQELNAKVEALSQ